MNSESLQHPKVSVITIFYNPGAFLEEAIESVLAQSYSDWELLLVNDGSTDGSEQIAEEYARRWPERIRYLTHPGQVNRGMSATRNLGLENANGEFVAFLDADDVWIAHKLAEQVPLLEAHPDADMLCGGTVQWVSWTDLPENRDDPYVAGDIRPAEFGPRRLPLEEVVGPPSCMLEIYPLGEGASPSMSNLIFRRDLARRIGGFEENFRGMYEDQVFLAKIYLSCKVLISSRIWDYYRQHPRSCMATTSFEENYRAREAYLHWIGRYIESRHADNPLAYEAIKDKLDGAWRRWHSRSLKRSLICATERVAPPALTIRFYIIWSKLRETFGSETTVRL